jgi:RND family efflux transporter MFP subunit
MLPSVGGFSSRFPENNRFTLLYTARPFPFPRDGEIRVASRTEGVDRRCADEKHAALRRPEVIMELKRRTAAFFLVPISLALLAGCAQGPGSGGATPTPYPTLARVTYTVQRGDIVINAKLSGRVEPVAVSSVSFSMEGHVDHVYVQPNEVVTKGELLADLKELKDLESKAKEIRRAVERAQIDLQIAQTLLAKYKAGGFSTYDVQLQELNVRLAEINLEEVLAQYGLGDASTALDAIDAQVNAARVFAPADGLIITGTVPGRVVTIDTVVFVIGDPNRLEVAATPDTGPPEDVLKQMVEGMPVIVISNVKPDQQMTGKIRQLPSPYGTGDGGNFIVRIVVDQAPSVNTYQSGDKVSIRVQLANKQGILWLPPAAIHQVGGRTFVIADSGLGPQRLEIEIGVQTQDKVEIVSGLKEGQVVIGL